MEIVLSAAGSLVQPFIDSVYNRVEQFIESRIMLVKEAESELHRLRDTLPLIQGVVEHVADTQSKNVAVRSWLSDLKDVLYDVEDLLDLTDVEITLGNAVGVSVAQEINKINDRLDDIHKQGDRYKIWKIAESSGQSVSSMIIKNRDTTSVPDVNLPTIGRDDDRDEIIDMFVNARSGSSSTDVGRRNLSVLPIVGMGGLGKTSLARLVFNHEKVNAFFRLKMWVCVGMYYHGFDLKQITIDIINTIRIRNESGERCDKSMSLESLQMVLIGMIVEKQPFLLVLDDAWDENYRSWNELLKPLRALGQDNWLIVTTRKMGVADTIRGQQPEPKNLDVLDDGSMWEIFKMHALYDEDACVDSELERIGKGIVERLKGMPLAALTVGSILRGNTDVRQWERVSRSQLLKEGEDRDDMLPILLLSYYSLPAYLKQCFSYFSLFKKDQEFSHSSIFSRDYYNIYLHEPERVIDIAGQLMVHNFLWESVFYELVNWSLLQCQKKSSRTYFVMHDLIHDLAEMISEGDFFRESNDSRMKPTKKVRHISLYGNILEPKKSIKFKIDEYSRLRTLVFNAYIDPISEDLLDSWFKSLIYLRVLHLNNNEITSLPNSIGNLKLLRYLYLDLPKLKELPETVCNLCNLQVLRIVWNLRFESPSSLTKLVNLKYLNVHGFQSVMGIGRRHIGVLIKGIGALTNLQWLKEFHVRTEEGYKISELKKMNSLSYTLTIYNLKVIHDKESAQEAQLHRKENLERLCLVFSDKKDPSCHDLQRRFNCEENKDKDLNVLEGLCPSNRLRSLCIYSYMGRRLPKWLTRQHLTSLKSIKLNNCMGLKSFPPQSIPPVLQIENSRELSGILHLPSTLRQLELINVGVVSIQPELSLPSLKTLKIAGCTNLDDCLSALLKGSLLPLNTLFIDKYSYPLGDLSHLTTLRTLILKNCSEKVILDFSALSSLKKLVIYVCPRAVFLRQPTTSILQRVHTRGFNMEQLRSLLSGVSKSPVRLLKIKSCDELMRFHGDLEMHLLQLTTLQSLYLANCKNLLSLPTDLRGFKHLHSMAIVRCPKMKLIPRDKRPILLEYEDIYRNGKWKA